MLCLADKSVKEAVFPCFYNSVPQEQTCSVYNCDFPVFENGKCIFHCGKDDWFDDKTDSHGKKYRDWSKSGKNIAEFWREIREKKMANSDYNFSSYVFPDFEKYSNEDITHTFIQNNVGEKISVPVAIREVNFWGAKKQFKFLKAADFMGAEFSGNADFGSAEFSGYANFRFAEFSGYADFGFAKFSGNVDFWSAGFSWYADFGSAKFSRNADFGYTKFSGNADFGYTEFFGDAKFSGDDDFWSAEFSGYADFGSAKFFGDTDFWDTKFFGTAVFRSAEFSGNASFMSTKFFGGAYFGIAKFFGGAYFGSAEFSGYAYFGSAEFSGNASFMSTKFSREVNFGDVTFSEDHQTLFDEIKFSSMCLCSVRTKNLFFSSFKNVLFPSAVTFRRCDLSRVSFTDANIERARFDECEFGRLKPGPGKDGKSEYRKSEPRIVLWDSKEVLRNPHATANDFETVEIRYRQFKKNFEEKRDWESAGDFYHGEMLMRLKKFGAERDEKVRHSSWWKRFFLGCYYLISDFNESPMRAVICLGSVILVSTCVFLLGFFFTLSARIPEQNTISLSYLTELLRRPNDTRPPSCIRGDEIRYGCLLEKSLHYSVSGSIPLYSLSANEEADFFYLKKYGGLLPWYYRLEVFLSVIVWTLLVLSIRQKFKR